MPRSDTAPTPRPLRRDAQLTRQRVLDAARPLVAAHGLDVSFDEIARAAGVGVGTVYRRFPDRASLAEALFSEKIEQLIGVAEAAMAIADPWESLVDLAHTSIRRQQEDRGLLQVLSSEAFGDPHLLELRDRAGAAVGAVLTRAQDAGVVRADLTPIDLILHLHLFSHLYLGEHGTDDPDGGELWHRSLHLFLDAVRPRPDQAPLPGPALSIDRFELVARRL